ncbi:tRNA pseudouridine(38/39) synthase-like [Acropora palmata]|uniref:tRNA pseudouridine(38/39) synthase-like n=1 Tax=Acropora palmata TaxID=6131 RepID=UPI003DA05283
MDGVDHTEVEELMSAELASLSKQELIARVLKLVRDNKELTLKLGEENVKEEFSYGKPCQNKTSKNTDVGTTKEKKQKVFDFSRYHKRHVAMKLAYLGWDYHGFACQESTENTIEGHFFAALVKACLIENRTDSNYSRCGRTDKGVSAFGQVVSLDVRSNLAEGLGIVKSGDQEKVRERIEREKGVQEIHYVHVLNKLLPPEIRVIAWQPLEQDFDARFSCQHRTYKYFFPAANLDINAMNIAAQKLVGKHDFRNFCKMDVANGVVTFERDLLSFTVSRVRSDDQSCYGYDMCEMTICGSAFLWHQVRCMVAVLLMIGQNLENTEVIDWMLDIKQCPRRPQYNMASEIPLVLYDCAYDKFSWQHETGILGSLIKEFQGQWTSHAVKTTMFQSLINSFENSPMIKPIVNSSTDQIGDEKTCDNKPQAS